MIVVFLQNILLFFEILLYNKYRICKVIQIVRRSVNQHVAKPIRKMRIGPTDSYALASIKVKDEKMNLFGEIWLFGRY